VRIVTVGGGPAGLLCSFLIKAKNPRYHITLLERNTADFSDGWGIVLSERTLKFLQEVDPQVFNDIMYQQVMWDSIEVRHKGEAICTNGHAYSAIARKRLLAILQQRCEEVGVNLKFQAEFRNLSQLDGVDLIIGADGINSTVRRIYSDTFKPVLETEKLKYIWLGTDKVFDTFTFILRETRDGLFQGHSYPFDRTHSTIVVFCTEATWRRAGLDRASEAETIAHCEGVFEQDLDGCSLMSNNSRWIGFKTVKNEVWHADKVVLLGDAAHTVHPTIGSGTKLALEDGIALAHALTNQRDLEQALIYYEQERKPAVEVLQEVAAHSKAYFENLDRYVHLQPMQLTFHLLTRSLRVDYDNLMMRDALFVGLFNRWFVGEATKTGWNKESMPMAAPTPILTPFRLKNLTLPNRVVLLLQPVDSAADGHLPENYLRELLRAARSSPALLLTSAVAVSREGRTTQGCLGIYLTEHFIAWARIVDAVHRAFDVKLAIQIGHAGLSGFRNPLTRSSRQLLYTSDHMSRAGLTRIRDDFVYAAKRALDAGFDILQLDKAFSDFLVYPYHRDEHSKDRETRPYAALELFDAVRNVWPSDRSISVAIRPTDSNRGTANINHTVMVAKLLKAHGCDLIHVLSPETTTNAVLPPYNSGTILLSDYIRNIARVATLVGERPLTAKEVNTLVASGRADLCISELDSPDSHEP
jgi:anthraniloyl-CoA monooxygenase